MTIKLPWRPIPVTGWPDTDQRIWQRIVAQAGSRRAKEAVRVYGQLLASADGGVVDRAAVERFCGVLEETLRPGGARMALRALVYALANLRPDEPGRWGWIAERGRQALRRARGTGTKPKPAGALPQIRIPIRDWPAEHRARWVRGLIPPPASAPADRYAHLGIGRYRKVSPDGEQPKPRPGLPRKGRKHPSSWSAATKAMAEVAWGSWLWWSQNIDAAPDPDVVTPERVGRYLDFRGSRTAAVTSITAYALGLSLALRIMQPAVDWTWLRQDIDNLRAMAKPTRDKFEKLLPIADLVRVGFELMEAAAKMPVSVPAAVEFRDGLMIALVCYRPKRLRNFHGIRVGMELTLSDEGEAVNLDFAETKNGKPSWSPVPDPLKQAFRIYLERFRPLFDTGGSDALWLSDRGQPLSQGGVTNAFRRRLKTAFGREMGLHMVRTLYATGLPAAEPALLDDVRAMLDHWSQRAIEHYEAIARSSHVSGIQDRLQTRMLKHHSGHRGGTPHI